MCETYHDKDLFTLCSSFGLPDNVLLYFGEHDVNNEYEEAQFSLSPEKIIIHPLRDGKITIF